MTSAKEKSVPHDLHGSLSTVVPIVTLLGQPMKIEGAAVSRKRMGESWVSTLTQQS